VLIRVLQLQSRCASPPLRSAGPERGSLGVAEGLSRNAHARWPLERVEPKYRGEAAQRYRYRDGAGEVGVISSVTQPFCGDCTRARS